jgi:oligopeptide/dipeptide ABC transporter ATP-binding protein
MEPLLQVRDLAIEFYTDKGVARAVNKISFNLDKGEALGLVGESGCGKTVTSLSILNLIPSPPGKVVGGEIIFNGVNLLSLPESKMRKIRGCDISMIFQEPMTALNPVFTVGNQLTEIIRIHQKLSRRNAWRRALEMLEVVGIPAPKNRIKEYPHQLSGGMRQRVMIAFALASNPKVLIADEPTTALDVTIQAQVMDEIKRLQREFHMGMILVTHDMGVIAETCENVIVMYCGDIVEKATAKELFAHPEHPYTRGLLNSIPKIRKTKLKRLPIIKGMVPDLLSLPPGCPFADRCKNAQDFCRHEAPTIRKTGEMHWVSCHFPLENGESV